MEDLLSNTTLPSIIPKLAAGENAMFNVNVEPSPEKVEDESRMDKVFKFEDIEPYINLNCISNEENGDSGKTPFEQLKLQMSSITNDRKVSKLILEPGEGNVVPPRSVVYVHYNSYFEMEEIPFDSSYIRLNKPLRIDLEKGEMFKGFEISLLTMKAKEKSQFLIHPDYAYGKMGSPPRIPPNATILLEIVLLNIVDCDGIQSSSELVEYHTFEEVYKQGMAFRNLGNDYFQQGNIVAAIENYKQAELVLSRFNAENGEEALTCEETLLKIYVNLSICYNHHSINTPERVPAAAAAAFYKCTSVAAKSAKLFFNLGKAFLALNEYEKANKNLRKAKAINPLNEEINELLKIVENQRKTYAAQERSLYEKAFNFRKPSFDEPMKKENEPESEAMIFLKKQLNDFAETSVSKIELPPCLTRNERLLFRKYSEELGLTYTEKIVGNKVNVVISK